MSDCAIPGDTRGEANVSALVNRPRGRRVGFYLCPDFEGKGPRVALLSETKWTPFLKRRFGMPATPFYQRPCRSDEPDIHPNGHPWAWLYKPEDVLKDESRWLPPSDCEVLTGALQSALKNAHRAIHAADQHQH